MFGAGIPAFVKVFFPPAISSYRSIEDKLLWTSNAEQPAVAACLNELRHATGDPSITFKDVVKRFLQGSGPVNAVLLEQGAVAKIYKLPADRDELNDPGFRSRLLCRASTGGESLTSLLQVSRSSCNLSTFAHSSPIPDLVHRRRRYSINLRTPGVPSMLPERFHPCSFPCQPLPAVVRVDERRGAPLLLTSDES